MTSPDAPTVVVLRWPEEESARVSLVDAGTPCLLLVAPEAPPPTSWGPLEDWVREPAVPGDVSARTHNLALRLEAATGSAARLDDDGIVRHGGRWVAVPPVEAKLLALLLERAGELVHRRALFESAWPAGAHSEHILDRRMKSLRERLAPLDLTIHTVRGAGFILEIG